MIKVLPIALLFLTGWTVEYTTTTKYKNEFNEGKTTHKEPLYISSERVTNKGNKMSVTIDNNSASLHYSGFFNFIVDNNVGKRFFRGKVVAIRTPQRKVIYLNGSILARTTFSGAVYLSGEELIKFIKLLKDHRYLKISLKGDSGNLVFDLNCNGFTKAWKKAGWQ